jgi:hypothetical protein
MLLGTALLNGLGVSLPILFVGAVFLATRIAIEERLMNKRFPDEYARYASACRVSFPASGCTAGRTDWRHCLRRHCDLPVMPARSAA